MRVLYRELGFTEGPTASTAGLVWVSVSKGDVYLDGGVLANLGGGPNGSAEGPDGSIYVTQNGGVDFASWGLPADKPYEPVPPGVVKVALGGRIETIVGPEGLKSPNDLAFVDGTLYFTDSDARLVLDADMNVISSAFEYPNGIAASSDGIWVADTARRRVVCLGDGRAVEMPGAGPDGICFDSDDRLYAACTSDQAVHVFDEGRHIGSYAGEGSGLFTNCCIRDEQLIVTSSLAGSVISFDLSELA